MNHLLQEACRRNNTGVILLAKRKYQLESELSKEQWHFSRACQKTGRLFVYRPAEVHTSLKLYKMSMSLVVQNPPSMGAKLAIMNLNNAACILYTNREHPLCISSAHYLFDLIGIHSCYFGQEIVDELRSNLIALLKHPPVANAA